MKKMTPLTMLISSFIAITLLISAVPSFVMAADTTINIDATKWEYGGSGQVSVTIDNASNLDAGQFDILFDSAVADVEDVQSGSIDGTDIPIDMWKVIEPGRVRVLFNLPGVDGVSGTGELAQVNFNVEENGESEINIADIVLADTEATEISGNWEGSSVLAEDTSEFELWWLVVGIGIVIAIVIISYMFFFRRKKA